MPDLETITDAAVEADELKSALIADGIGMTDLKAANNNADTYVTIYHAYDGRAIRVPFYMVDTTEGVSLLQRTFTSQDLSNASVGPEWLGKRVWYTKPQPAHTVTGRFMCPFSAFNPEEEKEAMLERGFRSDCRKEITFVTRDEVERHVEKRHPRRHEALRRQEEREYRERQDLQAQANTETLAALVRQLQNVQKGK